MDAINNAKLGENIDTRSLCNYFQSVKFTYNASLGYTWMASSKAHARNIYPMASTKNVKFFKTLNGAKRNFIKRIVEEP